MHPTSPPRYLPPRRYPPPPFLQVLRPTPTRPCPSPQWYLPLSTHTPHPPSPARAASPASANPSPPPPPPPPAPPERQAELRPAADAQAGASGGPPAVGGLRHLHNLQGQRAAQVRQPVPHRAHWFPRHPYLGGLQRRPGRFVGHPAISRVGAPAERSGVLGGGGRADPNLNGRAVRWCQAQSSEEWRVCGVAEPTEGRGGGG